MKESVSLEILERKLNEYIDKLESKELEAVIIESENLFKEDVVMISLFDYERMKNLYDEFYKAKEEDNEKSSNNN